MSSGHGASSGGGGGGGGYGWFPIALIAIVLFLGYRWMTKDHTPSGSTGDNAVSYGDASGEISSPYLWKTVDVAGRKVVNVPGGSCIEVQPSTFTVEPHSTDKKHAGTRARANQAIIRGEGVAFIYKYPGTSAYCKALVAGTKG